VAIEWYNFRWPWVILTLHCILTSQISQKRCVLGTKLLKNTNRKPYSIYRMVLLSMTLSDLWPRFPGHDIFRHWISETTREGHSYYRTSIGSRMRSIEWLYFQWPWRTHNPVFKVTALLKSNISKRTLIRNYTPVYYTTFNDLEWPLTRISRSRHFWRHRKNGVS